jgi:phosphatidylglycerophosphatase C
MEQRHKQIVAYFDFDGTLTYKDTLLPFLLFTVGVGAFIRHSIQLIFILFQYLIKYIDNEEAKERTLTLLLSGKKEYLVEYQAKNFALTKLHKYIKPVIYSKIEWHREHGHKIIIVSANLAIYLRYWANLHKLDGVIATELDVNNGCITGKLATRNCYGKYKVERIGRYLTDNQLDFCYCYAYGNSAGDYELLEYSNEPFWVNGDYISVWNGR